MKNPIILRTSCALFAAGAFLLPAAKSLASSHQDAPLIILDPAANTTDVYAFLSEVNGVKYLEVALGVFPFEQPGIGPNKFNFDDNVLYSFHVCVGDDVAAGRSTYTYHFHTHSTYKSSGTVLYNYLGVINDVGDANQNFVQTYDIHRKVDATGVQEKLGSGICPPNNEGVATPLYNTGDVGDGLAKDGVSDATQLDHYTAQSIATMKRGYLAFAGQRDDGFYADIQAVFDLLSFTGPNKPFDSQAGFNIHEISLRIPISELGTMGDQQVVGVYATTSRRTTTVLSSGKTSEEPMLDGAFVQVARQGNPLFNEALVAIEDKDLYSRTQPKDDATIFAKYALTPELAHLINVILKPTPAAIETGRTDLAGIFIPDIIKVDLSTAPARLAGGTYADPTANNDAGYSPLGIFGGDVLTSTVQTGFLGVHAVPGGWPNGRRFGDDVLDIAVEAILSDLRNPTLPVLHAPVFSDGVVGNDIGYNRVFPYAATPHNARSKGLHD